MNISELKKHIKSQTFQSLYIFYGDEWKIQDIYIEQMEKVIGQKVYCDTVMDILPRLNSPLFSGKKKLFIVRDDRDFLTSEPLQSRLLDAIGQNVLILRLSSLDKRMKFIRTYESSLIEFSPLETAKISPYVRQELPTLSDANISRLIQLCENDYGRILLEVDKINCYGGEANNTFQKLLEDGTIYEPPYDALFDFVDEVIKANVNHSYDLLQQCYEVGEATLVLLSVLYNTVKQVLQVQTCQSKDIGKTTGLSNWQIKKAKEKVGYRSTGELVYMLKLIQKVEKGIKTGRIEEEYAMQYLLANVL